MQEFVLPHAAGRRGQRRPDCTVPAPCSGSGPKHSSEQPGFIWLAEQTGSSAHTMCLNKIEVSEGSLKRSLLSGAQLPSRLISGGLNRRIPGGIKSLFP